MNEASALAATAVPKALCSKRCFAGADACCWGLLLVLSSLQHQHAELAVQMLARPANFSWYGNTKAQYIYANPSAVPSCSCRCDGIKLDRWELRFLYLELGSAAAAPCAMAPMKFASTVLLATAAFVLAEALMQYAGRSGCLSWSVMALT